VISGLAQGDTIDLPTLDVTVQDYVGDALTLVGDATVTLQLPGPFTAASFETAPDAGVGTDIFLACFAAGTRLATELGEIAVEALRTGHRVLTQQDDGSRVPRPVRWIGRRRIDLTHRPRPELARPIRICRGAFGGGLPSRDLLLSPDHAIYAEGVLIPVKHLVTPSTIMPARQLRDVEYYHVEVERHSVLLAEGLPVESYLDTGDRSSFENGEGSLRLHPDFSTRVWEAGGCAPLVVTGYEVDVVRAKLRSIAEELSRRRRVAA
jgi:hypothetical protein